ncbi:hypothetical protein ACFLSV_06430 [Bacteroidota bacterium]
MKKVLVLFIIILLPLTTFAQDKLLSEINKQIKGKPQKITKQELNSKLVNEWGEKELKFLELKSGKLIPMSVEKSKNLLKIQDTQDLEPWVYAVIVVGIVLIVVLVFVVLIVLPDAAPKKKNMIAIIKLIIIVNTKSELNTGTSSVKHKRINEKIHIITLTHILPYILVCVLSLRSTPSLNFLLGFNEIGGTLFTLIASS